MRINKTDFEAVMANSEFLDYYAIRKITLFDSKAGGTNDSKECELFLFYTNI